MGGGSGLLCLRTTVALRIRVPPTFHPGPPLPTTAHGARPAPAPSWTSPPRHLSPRTDISSPLLSTPILSSQHCVLASLLLHHHHRHHHHPEIREKRPDSHEGVTCCFLEARRRQKDLEEMIQGGEGGAKNASESICQEVWSGYLFSTTVCCG